MNRKRLLKIDPDKLTDHEILLRMLAVLEYLEEGFNNHMTSHRLVTVAVVGASVAAVLTAIIVALTG